MTIKELVRQAFIESGGIDGDYQSFPIPLLTHEGLKIAFFFTPSRADPKIGLMMGPPRRVVQMNPSNGKLEEIRQVSAKDFGLDHKDGEIMGIFAMPEGMTVDDQLMNRDSLYELYDRLLPEYIAGKTAVDDKLKKAAGEFQELFVILSEPPMKPYYRALGKDFFAWVDQIIN